MLGVAAITITALLLAILCRDDPKRRRAARLTGEGSSRAARWALTGAACLPGIACLLLGDTAAFLIWMGGGGLVGWLVAVIFQHRDRTMGSHSAPRR
jgi:hypothetical protein